MSDIASILGQPFDPGAQEASQAWEPLAPGWYNAYVEKEEIKLTHAGDGYFLKLQFCVIDGPSQNRKVFTNINLSNPSEQCVKIGKADLTALTQSLDIPLLQDTSQLLNEAVQIRVTVKKDQNEIKGYKPIDQSQPATPAAPVAPVPPTIAPPAGIAGGQGAVVAPAPVAPAPVTPIRPTVPVARPKPPVAQQPVAPVAPQQSPPTTSAAPVEPWKQ